MSLLPPNAAPMMKAAETAVADAFDGLPIETIKTLWNPWTCPAEYLPVLAQAVRVIHWRGDWPEEVKRTMIARSWEVNAKLGKISGIKAGLACLGKDAEIVEWFAMTPEGPRGTFGLKVDLPPEKTFAAADLQDIHTAVNLTKRTSQHLTGVTLTARRAGVAPYLALRGDAVHRITVYPRQVRAMTADGPASRVAVAAAMTTTLTITSREALHV